MAYVPFLIQVYDSLKAALEDGINPELAAVGQLPVPPGAFMVSDPALLSGETVALVYNATKRTTQAKHWTDESLHYELYLWAFGVNATDLNRRLMYLEFAACQVIAKNATLGGLLRTALVHTSRPWVLGRNAESRMADGIMLPIECQPDVRVPHPERSIP